jgi:stage II sporulation protein R
MLFCALGVWILAYIQEGQNSEALRGETSLAVAGRQEIPKQAIRLRILANSDSSEDQWLKRRVRDEIVKEIQTWARQPKTIGEARTAIRERLPLLREIAMRTVRHYGYAYPVKVDFGIVPFPTKLYGDTIYPAGNYEALRITIGKGAGGNWWCVLFPPLCFIDMSNGDAIDGQHEPKTLSASLAATPDVYAAAMEQKAEAQPKKMQVRFLLLDELNKWLGH